MTQRHPSQTDTARRERLAESTLNLVAFDTQNPPGETTELLAWLEEVILKWGVDTEWIESTAGKPNLVATIPGDSEWTLLYEGHVDTVPFDRESWSYDPLGERINDRIYGRGATDMKGTVAAMVETLRQFATADKKPPIILQFAFVSDEETGGNAGIDAVLAADAISADAAVVGETTATDDRYSVAVADKGRIWLTLEASGEPAHGSRPICGENAVDRLYQVVSGCRDAITTDRLSYPEPVERIVAESVDYYNAHPDDTPLASPDLFAYPTVNLGRLEGGSTVNSVPGMATAEVDIRVTPGTSTQAVFDRIEACIGTKPDVSITEVSIREGTYTDPTDAFVEDVVAVGHDIVGQRVFRQCATGGGDVKKLRAAGVPAVEAAVGSDTAHQVDEYRARAQHYRDIREWANRSDEQATLSESTADAESVTDDARSFSEFHFTPSVAIEPRDYQQEALAAWRDNGRRGSVVLPTGSGKTFLAVQAIADAGVSTLVVVPTIDLMNQWHATLTNAFGDQLPDGVGVLGGGTHDVTNLTVTTYDSAYRYINEYGDQFGLLVVDEVHHLPAPTYQQIPEMTIAPYRLGLTATYERADGEHDVLEDLLGTVVYKEEVDELAGQYLSEYETLHLQVELTSDERDRYDEEYQIYREYVDTHDFDLWKENGYQEFLKRTSYDPNGRRALIAKQRAETIARTAEKKLDTLDNLLKRHYDDRTIIFTANNDFAYEISQEFVVPCITHQTDTEERTEILERFRTGQYSILATSQVLDEGIDVPAASVGIILSGSASKRQYAQRLGRILRPTDDNQPARLYEIISEDTMETYVSQHRRQGMS